MTTKPTTKPTTTTLKRESPAPTTTTDWPSVVEQLEADPGTWYLVAENASTSIPNYLRRRHGLDVKTRGNDKSTNTVAKVYARVIEKNPAPTTLTAETPPPVNRFRWTNVDDVQVDLESPGDLEDAYGNRNQEFALAVDGNDMTLIIQGTASDWYTFGLSLVNQAKKHITA